MTRRAPRLAALLAPLLLLAPGCGTIFTHRHHRTELFSGCKADLSVICAPFLFVLVEPTFLVGLPFCLAAGLADLPLSFVGDVCVLVGRAASAAHEESPPAEPPAPASPAPAPPPEEVEVSVAQHAAEPPRLTLEAGSAR